MSCVPAPACKAALTEATRRFPGRNTASDGICASPQHHQQNPNSDHETGDAWDLTHDPDHGCDVDLMFFRIVRRRDPRVKYLIRNRKILRSYDKPGIPAWTWSNYTGPNPHIKHGHCSILPGARHDTSPWFEPATTPAPQPPLEEDEMLIVFADKTGADKTQVLALDGHLYVIDEGDTAAGIAAAGYKTIAVGAVDYAQLKQKAEA